jgi:signal transduction histidine kinase
MLTNDLKKSTRTKDVERYDTLCDVNISCMAAVDILNDLLCYEKLESGILELHKENIVIEPFLKDCLSMFSVHAKECGVELSVTTYVSSEFSSHSHDSKEKDKNNKVSLSVLPHDSIYCDKFKMDQVVRNIVSNALKFTPRGGSVQIKAMFVCDAAQDTASCSTEPEVRTHVLFFNVMPSVTHVHIKFIPSHSSQLSLPHRDP